MSMVVYITTRIIFLQVSRMPSIPEHDITLFLQVSRMPSIPEHDITLYFRYVEAVFPGDFGIKEKPWFMFTKSYWCGSDVNMDEVGYIVLFLEVNFTHCQSDNFICFRTVICSQVSKSFKKFPTPKLCVPAF